MVSKLKAAFAFFLLLIITTIIYSVILILTRYEYNTTSLNHSNQHDDEFLPDHSSEPYRTMHTDSLSSTTEETTQLYYLNSIQGYVILSSVLSVSGVLLYLRYRTSYFQKELFEDLILSINTDNN